MFLISALLVCSAPGWAFDCSRSSTPYPLASEITSKTLQVFPAAGMPPKAVIVVVHGLNNKPEVMDPLVRSLAENGAEVFRVGLTGHRGDFEAMKSVTAAQWKNDLLAAYQAARKRADELGVPLEFVGYSLGALVHSSLVSTPDSQVRYDRQVLLAPAINVRTISHFVKFFGLFGRGFCVPSLNSPAHRANNGTAMAAYRAMFELISEFRKSGYRGMNIPTLLIGDPKDELVDLDGIVEDAQAASLGSWEVARIGKRDVEKAGYDHLITGPDSLGPKTWRQVTEHVLDHLRLGVPHPK